MSYASTEPHTRMTDYALSTSYEATFVLLQPKYNVDGLHNSKWPQQCNKVRGEQTRNATASFFFLVHNTIGLWLTGSDPWLLFLCSIRVSNELGAGNPHAARLSVYISGIMCLTEGIFVAIITVLVRDIWGYLYSNEKEVVKYVSMMMPILAISDFMDGIQCTLSGLGKIHG